MTFGKNRPIGDFLASAQAGADAPDDGLMGYDGTARARHELAFSLTEIRPLPDRQPADMIGSGQAGRPDAGPDGSGRRHHPPQVADDSGAADGSRDRGDADISGAFVDADVAWRQIRSVSARLELLRGFARALQEHSGELADRSRALQARSSALQSRATALKAQKAQPYIEDRSAPGVPLAPIAPVAFAPQPPVNLARQISPTFTAEAPTTSAPKDPATFAPNDPVPPRPYVGPGPQTAEIPLLGGDVTEGVVRVGRTVRRPVRPHTPAVHALLRHLEAAGFDGAPRVLGIDAKNREVLTYLPGVVTRRLVPRVITADSTLVSLATLQLRYHQAVAGFDPPYGAQWDGEVTRFVDGPSDIICHCDVNLENVIFRPGRDGPQPYAFIDFDLARPGTRLVDIIQTLRYWAPIADPADRIPALRNADAPARIAIFCEAYGLSGTERARLVPVASRWLCRSRTTIAERGRTRGGAWARMLNAGVGDRLLRSAVWLQRNRAEIEARLCRPHRWPA
jgi:Phosphotransferase enzyme family